MRKVVFPIYFANTLKLLVLVCFILLRRGILFFVTQKLNNWLKKSNFKAPNSDQRLVFTNH